MYHLEVVIILGYD